MNIKTLLAASLFLPVALGSCGHRNAVTVTVSNHTEDSLGYRSVEISASDVLSRLKSKGFYITDEEGAEVPSQLTHDSKIVFVAQVPPEERRKFDIHPSDSLHSYPLTVWGDFYPRRQDDIAFENEVMGFRLYGPDTRNRGEKAYGNDIFFKHPSEELFLPEIYAANTSEANKAKADSLGKIDPELGGKFWRSFSYHIDHGKGMDCYAVGPTLGDGAPALISDTTISYPWAYETAEILDNGPVRFTVLLHLTPRTVGGSPDVREHRLITLDSKSHLNQSKVWYDGLLEPATIVAGVPIRDDSEVIRNQEKAYIAYADPTQGPDNGKALLGVVFPEGTDSIISKENHVLLTKAFSPTDTLSYRWGFAWDRADIHTLKDWKDYLDTQLQNYTITIE